MYLSSHDFAYIRICLCLILSTALAVSCIPVQNPACFDRPSPHSTLAPAVTAARQVTASASTPQTRPGLSISFQALSEILHTACTALVQPAAYAAAAALSTAVVYFIATHLAVIPYIAGSVVLLWFAVKLNSLPYYSDSRTAAVLILIAVLVITAVVPSLPAGMSASAATQPAAGAYPNYQEPYFVEQNVFDALAGRDTNIDLYTTRGGITWSPGSSGGIVDDSAVQDINGVDATWIMGYWTGGANHWFDIHHVTQDGSSISIFDQDWSVFAQNADDHDFRFVFTGNADPAPPDMDIFGIRIIDGNGAQIVFSLTDYKIMRGRNRQYIIPFSDLVALAPAGFDWSLIDRIRVDRTAAQNWMLISDIQVTRNNPDFDVIIGVANHDLSGDGFEQRVDRFIDWFGKAPATATIYWGFGQPLIQRKDVAGYPHYTDLHHRIMYLKSKGIHPVITLLANSLGARSWYMDTDPNGYQMYLNEGALFDQLNEAGTGSNIDYATWLHTYVENYDVFTPINNGWIDTYLHHVGAALAPFGEMSLRIFHEPYAAFGWHYWGKEDTDDMAVYAQEYAQALGRMASIFDSEGATQAKYILTFSPYAGDNAFNGMNAAQLIEAVVNEFTSQGLDPNRLEIEVDLFTSPNHFSVDYDMDEAGARILRELQWACDALGLHIPISLGEYAVTGNAADLPLEQAYLAGHQETAAPYGIDRVSYFSTHLQGPRPGPGALDYFPPWEGHGANEGWFPQDPWMTQQIQDMCDAAGCITAPATILPVDPNGNGTTDIFDLWFFADAWGSTSADTDPDSRYSPVLDLDSDGDVDIADIMTAAGHWGDQVPASPGDPQAGVTWSDETGKGIAVFELVPGGSPAQSSPLSGTDPDTITSA